MSKTLPFRATPARRSGHRSNQWRPTSRSFRLGWRSRLILSAILLVIGLVGWAVIARNLAPASNTSRARFDAIIVLGHPADSDGNPTPGQLARVTEGVREYERGVAPRLILTGGAVRNQFVEARVMARSAEAQGIPRSAIFLDQQSRDTIQNACYAERIMKAHGWRSAEVVSSGSHLPRAALIFKQLPFDWRTHAAPPLEPESAEYKWAAAALEDLKTMRYLTWARWRERCEP